MPTFQQQIAEKPSNVPSRPQLHHPLINKSFKKVDTYCEPMLSNPQLFPFFIFISILIPSIVGLSNPDPASTQSLVVNPSPTSTIPAFPEQSDAAGCPLELSDDLFHGVQAACGIPKGDGSSTNEELHRSRCCPVLAAWLYSAYSAAALDRAILMGQAATAHTTSYDMPLLPDDSETCANDLGKSLSGRGIELIKPNETCDLVFCYCGIRLHPVSCPEAFSVTPSGKLQGDKHVKELEKNCLSGSSNVNGLPGLGGCSTCLHSLYLLNQKEALNASKPKDRTTKMHTNDCELMGLTWLLAKNITGYIHTVTNVLRAIMMSTGDPYPLSCALNSDGMPLAVDSTEISDQSSSTYLQAPIFLSLVLLFLLHVHLSLIIL